MNLEELNEILKSLERIKDNNIQYMINTRKNYTEDDERVFGIQLLNGNIDALIQSLNSISLAYYLCKNMYDPINITKKYSIVKSSAIRTIKRIIFSYGGEDTRRIFNRLLMSVNPINRGVIGNIYFHYYLVMRAWFEGSIRNLFQSIFPEKPAERIQKAQIAYIKSIKKLFGNISKEKEDKLKKIHIQKEYPYIDMQSNILKLIPNKQKIKEYENFLLWRYKIRNTQHTGGLWEGSSSNYITSSSSIIKCTEDLIEIWKSIIAGVGTQKIISLHYENKRSNTKNNTKKILPSQ